MTTVDLPVVRHRARAARAVLWALAAAEARRMLRHPLLWIGVALSGAMVVDRPHPSRASGRERRTSR